MDNERLKEIYTSLTAIPVLQKRLAQLEGSKTQAEEHTRSLLEKYNSEVLDVEHMKKDSLSNTLLKLIDKYEGKLDKETQEMLTAKLEYDKAISKTSSIESELKELKARVEELLQNKKVFEEELQIRERLIKTSITNEAYVKYEKLQSEKEDTTTQIIELEEAIKAAQAVSNTGSSAMEHLDSAEGWATFDVWSRGGIISHIAKYDHIDNAQENFNILSYQISKLKKELADVNLAAKVEGVGIDSTTRIFDFWFDNIFTDLNVRDKIREDQNNLSELMEGISSITRELAKRKTLMFNKLEEIENNIKELLISFNR